jgi:hypothetical protein
MDHEKKVDSGPQTEIETIANLKLAKIDELRMYVVCTGRNRRLSAAARIRQ